MTQTSGAIKRIENLRNLIAYVQQDEANFNKALGNFPFIKLSALLKKCSEYGVDLPSRETPYTEAFVARHLLGKAYSLKREYKKEIHQLVDELPEDTLVSLGDEWVKTNLLTK